MIILALDAEITPDNPLLAFSDLSALMKQAVSAVSMEKRHSHFQFSDDWRRWCFTSAGRIGIKHSLATLAPSDRRCEVEKQRPRRLGGNSIWRRGRWE